MIDIVVRLIAAWLANETHGVNALAAKLPRANVSGPDDDAPPLIAIVNDADDAEVARNVLAVEPVPAVVVFGDSKTNRALRGYALAKDVVIGIAFVTDDKADPVTMMHLSGIVSRAIDISLARFNVQSIAGAARALNGVSILEIASVEEQRVTAQETNRRLWSLVLPHCSVADQYAVTMLGAPQL
jgi:hypothetical protein